MHTKLDFARGRSLVLIIVMAMGLAGCEYWPPALLAQLEELRSHVQDLSDERVALETQLREATILKEELEGEVEILRQENQSLRVKVASLERRSAPRAKSTSRKARTAKASRGNSKTTRVSTSTTRQRLLYVRQPPMKGDDVRSLQKALDQIGVPVSVDGVYGRDTRAAVVWFQRKHDLKPDGVVGPGTWSALDRPALDGTTKRNGSGTRVVRLKKPHMQGSDVSKIQRALRHAGLTVQVDGTFGSDTQAAVKRFQRKKGLRADGVVGPATREALGLS